VAIRKKLNRIPSWNGAFEQWSYKWVNANYWRVAHVHGSKEDSLQECALVFARCRQHYYDKVDNHAWFMALYKRAIANEWHTHSIRDSRNRALVGPSLSDDENYMQIAGNDIGSTNWGETLSGLKTNGLDLLDALATIAIAPAELLSMLVQGPTRSILAHVLDTEDKFVIEAAEAFLHIKNKNTQDAYDIIDDLSGILEI
jgi:hypothetical protein